MAYSNIEDSRAAIRRHYYANREKYIQKNRLRRRSLRAMVKDMKSSTPCSDCRNVYPYYVMDFDHIDKKKYQIGELLKAGSKLRLIKEIAKCEIVCSNCHRIRTFSRMEVKLQSALSPGSSAD